MLPGDCYCSSLLSFPRSVVTKHRRRYESTGTEHDSAIFKEGHTTAGR